MTLTQHQVQGPPLSFFFFSPSSQPSSSWLFTQPNLLFFSHTVTSFHVLSYLYSTSLDIHIIYIYISIHLCVWCPLPPVRSCTGARRWWAPAAAAIGRSWLISSSGDGRRNPRRPIRRKQTRPTHGVRRRASPPRPPLPLPRLLACLRAAPRPRGRRLGGRP